MEPDIFPAPLGLKTSPSNIAYELTPAQKPVAKFTSGREMVLPIPQLYSVSARTLVGRKGCQLRLLPRNGIRQAL